VRQLVEDHAVDLVLNSLALTFIILVDNGVVMPQMVEELQAKQKEMRFMNKTKDVRLFQRIITHASRFGPQPFAHCPRAASADVPPLPCIRCSAAASHLSHRRTRRWRLSSLPSTSLLNTQRASCAFCSRCQHEFPS
jgi:hypothetical protein